MQSKLVIANWKLYPRTEKEAVELAKKEDLDGVVLMPPMSFLAPVGEVLKNAELGAQDVFYESPPAGGGAYTGEVSPEQLQSIGVRYVLVGHSERRALGETDEVINKKVLAALKEGLKVVLCVGEKERQRTKDKGLRTEKEFVRRQLERALRGLKTQDSRLRSASDGQAGKRTNVIIAYEPVWAISSHSYGVSDSPRDAAEMARHIREFSIFNFQFPIKVLYGGSVNASDVREFLERKEIDGVLVGAASLDAEEFGKIVEVAARI